MSYTTLFTCGTSSVILVEIFANSSNGIGYHLASMASLVVMALSPIKCLYVLSPSITPTDWIFGNTAKYCQISLSKPAFLISSL